MCGREHPGACVRSPGTDGVDVEFGGTTSRALPDAVRDSGHQTLSHHDPQRTAGGELATGTKVGEFVVQRKIGAGAMGTVYGAVHPLIHKRAAIKVLSAALSERALAVERFTLEARAVNDIGHPNVVDIFAFGRLPDGRLYLAMEWLNGETLAARLARLPPTTKQAAEILDQVARALSAAHEKGIVHRDLKPANIFLAEDGEGAVIVKLLDFGIAKLLGEHHEPSSELTHPGALLGTPRYLSPEQARGTNVSFPTDVYALGAVAFEMFVGQPPFRAASTVDLIAMHLRETPPRPGSLKAGLPEQLDTLLARMLSKSPEDRPSLANFREALADLIDGRAFRTSRVPGRGWLSWKAALCALVVAALAICFALLRERDRDATSPAALGGSPTRLEPEPALTELSSRARDPDPAPSNEAARDPRAASHVPPAVRSKRPGPAHKPSASAPRGDWLDQQR
jgi:serine/threonine protein kinase